MELALDLLLLQRLLISSSTPAPCFNKLAEPGMCHPCWFFTHDPSVWRKNGSNGRNCSCLSAGRNAVCQHQKDTAWVFFLVLLSYGGNTGFSKVSFLSRQKPSCDHIMGKNHSDCNSWKDKQALSVKNPNKPNQKQTNKPGVFKWPAVHPVMPWSVELSASPEAELSLIYSELTAAIVLCSLEGYTYS